MLFARMLAPVGAVLALGGCVVTPPPSQAVLVLPQTGKDPAVFQQDERTCRQAVAAQPGQAGASQAAGANTVNGPAGAMLPGHEIDYAQCMAALGNTVQSFPGGAGYAAAYPAYGYAYPYPYAYPDYAYGYGYPYAYPGFFGGFYGGWGGGWGGWRGGGWREGGWHGGGWGRGGWGGGGWHGGGWHGGGGVWHH